MKRVKQLALMLLASLLAPCVWAAIPEATYTYDGHTYTHTGWFSGPGENFSNSAMAFGPRSMGTVGILDADHHPYTDAQLPESFTLATYMDLSLATNGSTTTKAVVWSTGDNASSRVMLVTDGANAILSATGGDSVSLPLPSAGYHLYTATFSTSGISLTIDDGSDGKSASHEGSYNAIHEHFQIGSVYNGCPSGYGHATAIAVAKMIGFNSVLSAENIAELSAANPAVAESTATGAITFAGSKIYAANVTHTAGRLEVNRGTLVVPAGRTYSVPALRFGNSQADGENGLFGMDVDGTLTISGASTADGNGNGGIRANVTANVGGILGGEWEGKGTYNIRGTLDASNNYVQLVFDAHAQTWNIENGGVLKVKGFQANTANGKARSSHVLNIKNGGAVISAEGYTRGKLMANVEEGGVLELSNSGNQNMEDSNLSGIIGEGTLKFSNSGGTGYVILPKFPEKYFADTLAIENNLTNGLILSMPRDFSIGSLSGTGMIRSDWNLNNAANGFSRTLTIKQRKNTVWSGLFRETNNRITGITVTSENGSSLTKTGENGGLTTPITVSGNATFIIGAAKAAGKGNITLNGGKLQAKAVSDAHGFLVKDLILEQDGTYEWIAGGNGNELIGIGWGGTEASTISLNDKTLTLTGKTVAERVYLDKTTISTPGTINITKGKLFLHCSDITTPEDTKIIVGEDALIEGNGRTLTVQELEYNGTVISGFEAPQNVVVTKKVSGTGALPKLKLADGATIAGSLTVSGTATFGATVKVADGASISVPANTTLPLVVDESGAIRGTLNADGSMPAVNPSIKVSELPSISVTLADGVTLVLDAAAAAETTVSSTGTIHIADPNLGWAASIDDKSTVLSSKNIVLGTDTAATYWYDADGVKADTYFGHEASYWKNVFGGPTSAALEASTPTEAQWRELATVSEGKGRVPQYYDANQGGNCENWAPILLDGNLIPFVTAVDGYKTLKSDFYNGWNIRLALVNGVMLEMQALGKLQGETKFIGVDATSKLIIDSFQGGSNNHKISFDIASAEGLTVNSDMGAVGNENSGAFEYTFHGNGSIKIGGSFNLGASHTVKSADIEIGEGEYKTIRRKQLIAFNGTEMAQRKFTLEAVNVTDDSTITPSIVSSSTLLDGQSEYGTARLAVDQTGVYIEYVGKYNGLPPYYQWKFGKKNAAWGDSEGAWQGLFDTATPSLKVWSEKLPKTSSEQGDDLLNYAKDFVFIFDAATSDSVVVDASLAASRTHTYDGVEGIGYRRVKVTNTDTNAETVEKFSFNLPQMEGVDEQGAPLSTFDFSTYNVEMAAPVDATTFNGELGLRAKLTGPITLGPQTKIVFIAPENEETIAYDYNIADREGSVEVRGAGTFIVPNTMTGIPFEKTNGGSLKYDIPEGQTVTAAAISGNGGVIKAGAGTLKITEASSFKGDLKIEGGAVEVIAPSQGSEHAAIQVTVAKGAEMRLVLTDLTKDYTAEGITGAGSIIFVNTDGDVLESSGITYTGTASVAKVGTTNYTNLSEAFTAAASDASKMVTLIKSCDQAANIPAGVTLDTNGKVFEGAVTGSGTILFKNTAPTADALEKNAFTAEGWTGTVCLKNVGNTNINANQPLVAAGILMKLGNANSTLKLTDCRGYNNDDTNEYPFALELEDGECVNENSHYGWTNVSGYSSRTHTFKALKGTGTYIGTFCEEVEKFRTIEDFEGTLMINAYRGKKIVVGDVNAGGNGTLVLADGAKLKHAFTVKANGIVFGNTIALGDDIASVGSTVMTCPQPATIPAIAGDNMLVYENGALKVAATVAKIGDKKYASLDAAIAALTDGQNVTAITLVDTSITKLPAGQEDYKIEDGVIKAKTVYAITVVGENVSTTIPASVREDQNEISFTVMPDMDYAVKSVKVGDTTLVADENGVYTYTVTSDITVTITAVLDVTTITIPAAPANTTVKVTVDGAEVTPENNSITAMIGATVVVTYSAAEGYIMNDVKTTLTAGESTEITVPTATPVAAVAQIGTTLYPTLAAAFAVGGDVTLLQNTTETLTIAAGKSVTLDLNGKTITSAANTITVKGTLVVTEAAGGIASTSSGKSAITTSGSGVVTVNGGMITAVGTAVSGTATITGGTITSTGSYAAYANGGNLVITGGTLTGAASKGDVGVYTGNVKVVGVELANGIKFAEKASGLVLAGTDESLIPATADVAVYNGEDLEGYYFSSSLYGLYTGCKGKTCKLVKDITHQIAIGVNTTLDLNGYNITVTDAISAILVKSGTSTAVRTVTITGEGTVSCDNGSGCNAVQVQSCADVTIAGGSYYVGTDTASSDPDNATIYIVGSYKNVPTKVTITGGTFEAAGSGDFTLNIKDDQVANGAAISVKGGTFKNGFNPENCISEGKGTNFVAEGYESVKGNDNCYYVQVKEETPVVPEVTTTETTITPVVPQGGSVEVITPDGTTLKGSDAVISTAYVDTAALFTVITTTAEGVKTVANVGVINAKVEEANKVTTAVAVPFTGATVKNLLNTALLSNGDTLTAYVGGVYHIWKLTGGVWVGEQMTDKEGTHEGLPATTALARGTAVWVETAGQIVVLGKYDEKTEIVEPTTPETHILANPTMKPYTPSVKAGDAQDQVIEIGTTKPTRFTKKNGKWTAPIVVEHDDFFGDIVEERTVDPEIPVGKGFWFIKK